MVQKQVQQPETEQSNVPNQVTPATTQPVQGQPMEGNPVLKKWWFWVIIGLAVIGIGAGFYFWLV